MRLPWWLHLIISSFKKRCCCQLPFIVVGLFALLFPSMHVTLKPLPVCDSRVKKLLIGHPTIWILSGKLLLNLAIDLNDFNGCGLSQEVLGFAKVTLCSAFHCRCHLLTSDQFQRDAVCTSWLFPPRQKFLKVPLLWIFENLLFFFFFFSHLADAFIQSDLQIRKSNYNYKLKVYKYYIYTHLRKWRN